MHSPILLSNLHLNRKVLFSAFISFDQIWKWYWRWRLLAWLDSSLREGDKLVTVASWTMFQTWYLSIDWLTYRFQPSCSPTHKHWWCDLHNLQSSPSHAVNTLWWPFVVHLMWLLWVSCGQKWLRLWSLWSFSCWMWWAWDGQLSCKSSSQVCVTMVNTFLEPWYYPQCKTPYCIYTAGFGAVIHLTSHM